MKIKDKALELVDKYCEAQTKVISDFYGDTEQEYRALEEECKAYKSIFETCRCSYK